MKCKILLLALLVFSIVFSGCVKREINYSCNADSDCEIKNVGNACGGYPLCVNKSFIPNPPELDSMVCGFPSIDGCKCVEKKCVGTFSGEPNQ